MRVKFGHSEGDGHNSNEDQADGIGARQARFQRPQESLHDLRSNDHGWHGTEPEKKHRQERIRSALKCDCTEDHTIE